jgi:hypothetical protein
MSSSDHAKAAALVSDARDEADTNRRASLFLQAIAIYQSLDRPRDIEHTSTLFTVFCATVGYAREALRLHLQPRLERLRSEARQYSYDNEALPWADQRALLLMAEFPRISASALRDALTTCQQGWSLTGSAAEPTSLIPLVFATRLHDQTAIARELAALRPEPPEDAAGHRRSLLCGSYRRQCIAEARFLIGQEQRALDDLMPHLDTRDGCSTEVCALAPAGQLCLALLPLLRAGKRDAAEKALRHGLQLGASNGGTLRLTGCIVAYLALTSRPDQASTLLGQHLSLLHERATPWQAFHFLLGAEILAQRYPSHLAAALPSKVPLPWLRQRVETLAQQLDERAGNQRASQLLALCRSRDACEATVGL